MSLVYNSSLRFAILVQSRNQLWNMRTFQIPVVPCLLDVEWRRTSARLLYTTVVGLGGRPGNTVKKLVQPVVWKKSLKKTQPVVDIWADMTVAELAACVKKENGDVVEMLQYDNNIHKSFNSQSVIDSIEVIKKIVTLSGLRWKMVSKTAPTTHESTDDRDVYKRPPAERSATVKRPPVVAVMGHVDHGKTTLLDSLRNTNVVAMEFGGITQHIGAFSVQLSGSGDVITFLDTPGHAAFSAMRARGAMVTDMVVLVVAADDGVMKQTVESLGYARDANVPIVVAINKTDKPDADIERTKKMLLEHDVQLEDFGGDVQSVCISALKGTNLDSLQEAILALAEVLECRADPRGFVEATVVESKTDPGRGKLSTALIQRGSLKKGSVLVAGTAWAKVRGMFNHKGQPMTVAEPGMPVEVIGWRELPSAGEEILEVESEQKARDVVSFRQQKIRDLQVDKDYEIIRKKAELHNAEYREMRRQQLEKGWRLNAIYRNKRSKETAEGSKGPELCVVIKGDVDGSLEAILDILDTYNSPLCQLHLLSYGVGDITESDVEMAAIFNGVVYGFNVSVAQRVSAVAKSQKVKVLMHRVIYRLIADIKAELTDRLLPLDVEQLIGEASVLEPFTVTEGKQKLLVAGCRCRKGMLQKKKLFKLIRNGDVLTTGSLRSLKHFKNEVESIKTDVECGLSFEDQSVAPQTGDVVVCFEYQQVKPELNWNLEF